MAEYLTESRDATFSYVFRVETAKIGNLYLLPRSGTHASQISRNNYVSLDFWAAAAGCSPYPP
jgi:hypothetical protein